MSESLPEHRPQTADEVEQNGRLLLPQFREMLREELTPLVRRVEALESVKRKALLAYGIIVTAATFTWHAGKAYLIGRMERR